MEHRIYMFQTSYKLYFISLNALIFSPQVNCDLSADWAHILEFF